MKSLFQLPQVIQTKHAAYSTKTEIVIVTTTLLYSECYVMLLLTLKQRNKQGNAGMHSRHSG